MRGQHLDPDALRSVHQFLEVVASAAEVVRPAAVAPRQLVQSWGEVDSASSDSFMVTSTRYGIRQALEGT